MLVVEFLALLGFWFALSGRFEPLFVVIGVVTAAVVTALSHRLTLAVKDLRLPSTSVGELVRLVPRAVVYGAWLTSRAVVAGLQIIQLVLRPRLDLDPCVIRFRTELQSAAARTVFTNSISLVPGTLTVDLEGPNVVVHALFPEALDDVISGSLQNRVARLVGEGPQPPVDASLIEKEALS